MSNKEKKQQGLAEERLGWSEAVHQCSDSHQCWVSRSMVAVPSVNPKQVFMKIVWRHTPDKEPYTFTGVHDLKQGTVEYSFPDEDVPGIIFSTRVKDNETYTFKKRGHEFSLTVFSRSYWEEKTKKPQQTDPILEPLLIDNVAPSGDPFDFVSTHYYSVGLMSSMSRFMKWLTNKLQ